MRPRNSNLTLADGRSMTRLLFSLSVAALGLASVGSAVTTHTIVTPEPTATFDKTCAKTACEALREATGTLTPECRACISDWAVACADTVLCPDSEQTCPSDCRGPACEDPSACAEYTWVAHIEHFSATPGVEAACQNANAEAATRCG